MILWWVLYQVLKWISLFETFSIFWWTILSWWYWRRFLKLALHQTSFSHVTLLMNIPPQKGFSSAWTFLTTNFEILFLAQFLFDHQIRNHLTQSQLNAIQNSLIKSTTKNLLWWLFNEILVKRLCNFLQITRISSQIFSLITMILLLSCHLN